MPIELQNSKKCVIDDFWKEYLDLKNRDSNNESKLYELILHQIQNYFDEQMMSALVGSGFSKNANEKYPLWSDLLLDAYKEIRKTSRFASDKKLKDEISAYGESKLADEYINIKGGRREVFDVYIENFFNKIDTKKDNLLLHKLFLSLPWCDIITTNWDTLFERANWNLPDGERKYLPVIRAKALKNSNNHRIIKIHGSLRDKMNRDIEFDDCDDCLYIATKKDFNEYKIKHDGFSSFMKIKFIENAFCLFGFSGNDPNFQYWIKELKNIMTKGGDSEKPNPIFLFLSQEGDTELIGEANKIFYEKNYIVPIDIDGFSEYLNIKRKKADLIYENKNKKCGGYKEKLKIIFEYLSGLQYEKRVNCTPCQGHFYLFVLGNVCLSTLQLTIPSNG